MRRVMRGKPALRCDPKRVARKKAVPAAGAGGARTSLPDADRLRLLARVLETSGGAISFSGRDGRFLYVNRGFTATYGWEEDEVLGMSESILDSPRNEPWIREETSAATPKGGWSGVLYNTRRDGTEIPVALTTSPVTDARGDLAGTVRMARDITRELAVEEALRHSETQFRSIVESSLEAIVTLSPQGLIELYNPAAERLFGYPPSEVRGQPIEVLLPTLLGSLGVLPRVVEVEALRKDATRVPLEVSLSLLPTSSGHAVAAFLRDVTSHREVERLKDEFVTMLSHDLRTPLTAVGLSISVLLDGQAGPLPEKVRGVLEVASRNVARLSKMADDILDLKRLESGRLEMRLERFALPPLVDRCLEMVRPVASSRDVALESVPSDIAVLADPERIAQVLLNLLSNAIKFSPTGGRVVVELRGEEPWAEVRVIDEGPGIPPEHRGALFQRFRQVPGGAGKTKGTGLGLAISKAIVTQNGGEIGLESREGPGSCFWFRLRLAGN